MKHQRSFVHRSVKPTKLSDRFVTKTYSRASVILPYIIKHRIAVYNGHLFVEVVPTNDIVGYRLGEFVRTRRRGSDPRGKAKRIRRF